MKLISRFEAATRSSVELYDLRKKAFMAFSAAPRGSEEGRDALASMRNIERELASSKPAP